MSDLNDVDDVMELFRWKNPLSRITRAELPYQKVVSGDKADVFHRLFLALGDFSDATYQTRQGYLPKHKLHIFLANFVLSGIHTFWWQVWNACNFDDIHSSLVYYHFLAGERTLVANGRKDDEGWRFVVSATSQEDADAILASVRILI